MIYKLLKKQQRFALFPDHIKDKNHYTFFIFKTVGKPFWVKDKEGNTLQAILRHKREQRLPDIPMCERRAFCDRYSVSEAMFKSQWNRKPPILIEVEILKVNETERLFA